MTTGLRKLKVPVKKSGEYNSVLSRSAYLLYSFCFYTILSMRIEEWSKNGVMEKWSDGVLIKEDFNSITPTLQYSKYIKPALNTYISSIAFIASFNNAVNSNSITSATATQSFCVCIRSIVSME